MWPTQVLYVLGELAGHGSCGAEVDIKYLIGRGRGYFDSEDSMCSLSSPARSCAEPFFERRSFRLLSRVLEFGATPSCPWVAASMYQARESAANEGAETRLKGWVCVHYRLLEEWHHFSNLLELG